MDRDVAPPSRDIPDNGITKYEPDKSKREIRISKSSTPRHDPARGDSLSGSSRRPSTARSVPAVLLSIRSLPSVLLPGQNDWPVQPGLTAKPTEASTPPFAVAFRQPAVLRPESRFLLLRLLSLRWRFRSGMT